MATLTKKDLLEAIEDMPDNSIIKILQVDSWYGKRYTKEATKVAFYSPKNNYAVEENTIVIGFD